MKKLLTTLLALVAIAMTAGAQTKEAYAVVSTDGTTLTFYYDTQKAAREGTTYPISWSDTPDWFFRHSETILTADFDESFSLYEGLTSTRNMFYGLKALTTIGHLDRLNTSNVTDMYGMFWSCEALESLDVSHFNTANVTNMDHMFYDCQSLTTLDVKNFDTKNVTNMRDMFYDCQSLTTLDVKNFDTKNVTNMNGMFGWCKQLTSLDLSGFNTEKVTNMASMFYVCLALTSLDLSSFDTGNVTNMESMFNACFKLKGLDLSHFNTANVTNMERMFYQCSRLTTIFCNDDWNTSIVTNSSNMFGDCSELVGAASYSDSNANDITFANPNTGYFTFIDPSKPKEAYAVLDLDNGTLMFYYDQKQLLRPGKIFKLSWYGWASPGWAEYYGNIITTVDFDESFAAYDGMTYTHDMFHNLNNLTAINHLDRLNTANVTDMRYMFSGCQTLSTLDLKNFNTKKVTDMSSMFSDCRGLTSLDLSNFDTSNVTTMRYMFNNCINLTTIYCNKDWNTGNVTNSSEMFKGCSKLVGVASYDDSNANDITFANPETGYFTDSSKPKEAYAVLDGSTLKFYYDQRKAGRAGAKYELSWDIDDFPGWANNGEGNDAIITVDFDESFSDYDGLTNSTNMFYNLKNLTTINRLDRLNTENVTDMSGMFLECYELASVDLSHFNTSKVTNMEGMFNSCYALQSLDLSNFDDKP